ncbi:DnaJ domain-containing protein [Tropicimonas isoalkanivorans]|uniref:DnaJ domain-containing protein n=1 Tax=Tropicimonas isoalkanivorans TaxID=441112 RepID=A0A1I1NYV7_9RHOB|nr:DnaJ domain-containing protein [Tropicimonas isoalkanivorans]
MRARAAARELLGVGKFADAVAIRTAWRRAAFKAHPDRNDGEGTSFAQAKAAYELLITDAGFVADSNAIAEPVAPAETPQSEPSTPAKPKVVTRLLPLTPEAIDACNAVLLAERAAPTPGTGAAVAPAEHVPLAVAVHGRSLTYTFATPLVSGLNRVALPTAVLQDMTMATFEIVTFRSPTSGAGDVLAPDNIRSRQFPGARSVRLRFRAP